MSASIIQPELTAWSGVLYFVLYLVEEQGLQVVVTLSHVSYRHVGVAANLKRKY